MVGLTFTPSVGSPFSLPDVDPQYGITPVPNPDPNCASNQIYEIFYVFTNVPNSYFASGTVLSTNLGMTTDCSLVGNFVSTGDVTGPTFSQNEDLPCNRIDKVYIFPAATGVQAYTTALGNTTAICTHPTGFAHPDYHQLEYRQINSGGYNWDDQTSVVYWGIPNYFFSSTYLPNFAPNDVEKLDQMTVASGQWIIRYRNVKTSTCDIIYNSGSSPDIANPSPGPSGAGGIWGTPSLWYTEIVNLP